ncbi:putative a-pheromone processing metallopeptidase ste23 protein [Neofusicoccum parvum UCRNP2]|uniref:Putative a-pheromone processing metallopeptidase ste23 protein n=1 Tax=Botryosphaeria parva (strain UCR-NP2) TaxID=1287680 RepID=R1EUF6_BOTPV|nr:putative a-pheromone processing metallopeptidase ste23 protein [Neofusicoccum parvum UCRNP2]
MAELVNTREALPERLTENMERPALDDRTYRVIRLPNKLEALLIHDPDTDKVSAAMDVNVGSFSDADDMPGMAHAVEHLLFMGTKKYPRENAYNQYLTAHSGHSNAFTASTSTNYYFEVAAQSKTPPASETSSAASSRADLSTRNGSPLYGALDRFAQFFVEPLFLEGTLDRELKAVDSENKKNLQSDTWRLHQLNKTLSNPKHPFCHFSTGSYKTLHDDPLARGVKIRDEFIKFYEKNYSANRMKLVVLGREGLDELESWVSELFSEVKNKDLPRNRWDGVQPFTDNELLTQVFAKPVFDMRNLDLYFPYRDEEELYESQPGRYLSHLIGHEGPGSILAYIKAKGWASGLGAGPVPLCPGSAFFSISVRLTEDGLKNYKEVIKTIFQYISMLKEHEPKEWIFDEMKRMSEVDFRFRQKSPASSTASSLSGIMQKPYQRDHLLSGPALIRKFNPDAIKAGLACLRPDNFRMTIVSQEVPGEWDQREKWYGTEYKYNKIPQDFLTEIKGAAKSTAAARPAELHLPHKNEFIPTRLEVERKEVDEPMIAPKLIRNDGKVRLWYKKDDRFWVPKANVHVTLRTPLVSSTPQAAVMAHLYKDLVEDSLVEYSYDAELAGIAYRVSNSPLGVDVSVSGYNDKMPILLEKVLTTMRDLDFREDRFNIVKERLVRGFRNTEYQQPYYQVGTYTRWLSAEKGWINEDYLAELPHVTAEDIRHFYPQLLKQTHVEVLAHGNLYKEDALKMTDMVESTLKARPLSPSQWPIRRNVIFPEGSNYIYERTLKDPANVNHCIEYACSVGETRNRDLRAKLLLWAQITDEPAFNQLRTKEQLGYVVFSGTTQSNNWMGYRILIQSERSPDYLEERIDKFLLDSGKMLEEMPEDEFESHKESVQNRRREKLKNLTQETNRLWTHVCSESFDFELVDQDVAHIVPLTKSDLLNFFDHYISPQSASRAKISVHMLAQSSPAAIAQSAQSSTSPEKQATSLVTLAVQFLNSEGVGANADSLAKRLQGVDIAKGDTQGIIAAISAHLLEDLKIPQARAAEVLQKGAAVMSTALPSLGIDDVKQVNGVEGEKNGPPAPVKITDVRDFKAGLQVGRGPRAVKELSEFEDLESKL